ncbi:FG-GAP-like repeat-containing protein [Nonomuraea typhae]|uniref:FG-GAP-like repeat-containing protein n=1 Tax=Nonomuraea typhae TaxID=2603600 RepID=A0ABW7YXF7_9ACTN
MITKMLLAALAAAALTTAPALQETQRACTNQAATADFDGDGQDDAAVGDPFAGGGKGAVHLITGTKVTPLPAPAPAEGDAFGWSVKLANVNGDGCADLVVGAPYADVQGVRDAGAVHILYGGAAEPARVLTAPQPQQGAHFGWSLAANGGLLAIGAPHEDETQTADTGTVYIKSTNTQLRRINQESSEVPGNGEVGDQFGYSVALSRDRKLFVGVPYENDDGAGRQVGAGKVHSGQVTVINDATAPQLSGQKWDSPTKKAGDRFGFQVAYADGAGLAVSAPGPGYVQVYTPALRPARTIRQGAEGFGFSLAAAQDGRLAVGTPYGGGVLLTSFGSDAQDRRLNLDGWSVAFSGNRLLAGQPDAGRGGQVAILGRNADAPQLLEAPAGVDFGSSLTG